MSGGASCSRNSSPGGICRLCAQPPPDRTARARAPRGPRRAVAAPGERAGAAPPRRAPARGGGSSTEPGVVKLVIRPKLPLRGRVVPPGDKSITHRAVLIGLVASEPVRIIAPNPGADCAATLDCARALGASVEIGAGVWTLRGGRLREPDRVLDCGNSGTALRLLSGVLASHPIQIAPSADPSLNRRAV